MSSSLSLQVLVFLTFFFSSCLSQQNQSHKIHQNSISDSISISKRHNRIMSFTEFAQDENQKIQTLYAGNYYVKLHFTETPPVTLRKELENQGISLNHYLGNSTYLVAIPENLKIQDLQIYPILGISIPTKEDRLATNLKTEITTKSTQKMIVDVQYQKNINPQIIILDLQKQGIEIIQTNPFFNHIQIKTTSDKLSILAQKSWLVYAQKQEKVQGLGLDESHQVRSIYLQTQKGLTGKNINVGIWDAGSINPNHHDLLGRAEVIENVGVSGHAMTVVGILGASGAINPFYIGNAPEAKIYSWRGDNASPEIQQAIQNQKIVIGNHSYGLGNPPTSVGEKDVYDINNQFTDKLTEQVPYLVNVYAIGNSGALGYRSTHGNVAKNTITVGAVNVGNSSSGISSKGPSRDGRIHPQVMAAGFQVTTLSQTGYANTLGWGTSQATPAITGLIAQLFQYYTENHNHNKPPASLMKALVTNTAEDLGNKGPDYQYGFGRANGLRALKTLEENRYKIASVANGSTKTFTVDIPNGTAEAKVLLCWTDPASVPHGNTTPVLVNNLDLAIKHLPSGTITKPWILDPNNPASSATRGVDNLNNIEQITLDNPQAGTYEISIQGTNIPVGASQEFALVWQIEKPHIEISSPAEGDVFLPNTAPDIFWSGIGISQNQTLEYSLDNGATWQMVTGSSANPAPPKDALYWQWFVPNTHTNQARIRITSDNISAVSGKFSIFGRPAVNLISTDNQVNINWTTVPNATHYDVFRLDNQTGKWKEIATDLTATTSHTDTGLKGGEKYYFTVRAKNNNLGIIGEKAVAQSAIPTNASTIDLEIIEILNPQVSNGDFIRPTTTEFITIRIKNNLGTITTGTNLTARFSVDGGGWISQNFTTTTLNTNDQFNYQFTIPANFSDAKIYDLKAEILITGDDITQNNSFTKKIDGSPTIQIISDSPNKFCTVSARLELQGAKVDYAVSLITPTPSLEDMTGATSITLADHQISQSLPIGFRFPFYDQWNEQFYISDEGLITFDLSISPNAGTSGAIPNSPNLDNFIAGVWSDFNPAYGTIHYKTFGASPNRKLVVEFKDYPYWDINPPHTGYSSERATFQIHLHENGIIELHYQSVDANSWASSYTKMTAGIESPDGTKGKFLAGKNNSSWSINTPKSYRFTPTYPTWNNGDNSFFTTITIAGTYTVNWIENSKTRTLSKTFINGCGTAPTVSRFLPEDDATNIPITSKLKIIFDKNIRVGIGNLTLSNGTDIRVFPITGNSFVTTEIKGNALEIKLKNPLQGGTNYHVQIPNGAITDTENIPQSFVGIANTTTWNFLTENQAPTQLEMDFITVNNNAPDGTFVGKLKATDPDTQQNHTFAISGGSGTPFFRIQNNEIRTNGYLIFTSTYSLEITATDNGNPNKSIQKMFTIPMNFVTIVPPPNSSQNGGSPSTLNTILKEQKITFSNLDSVRFGQLFTLNAKAESGLRVNYLILSGNAEIIGSFIRPTGIGTVEILMQQAGGNGYKKAEIRHTLQVIKNKSVLSESQINTISDVIWTKKEIIPNFGLQNVTFEIIEGNEFATISGNKILLQKTGKIRLKIYIPETENYEKSNPIYRAFEILKASQEITFLPVSSKTFGDDNFELSANSSSGLKIVFYKDSDNLEILENIAQIKGAGEVKITAKQAGNEFYLPTEVSQTLTIQKASQTIQFDKITDKKITDKSFEIFAKASSKLPIEFSISPAESAEINDGKIILKKAGKIQITAKQIGNEFYLPALEIRQDFEVFPILEITNIQVVDSEKLQISVLQNGNFSSSNSFRIMLSDENGNFDKTYFLSFQKNASGVWEADLPEDLKIGANYQLKIQSGLPRIETKSFHISETLFPRPKKLKIQQNGNKICAIGEAEEFIWYLNDEILEGQKLACLNLNNFKTKNKLVFKVRGKNSHREGRISSSFFPDISNITSLENSSNLMKNIQVFPNPTDGKFIVILKGKFDKIEWEILDISGRVLQKNFLQNHTDFQTKIDLRSYHSGLYFLHLKTDKGTLTQKIILK